MRTSKLLSGFAFLVIAATSSLAMAEDGSIKITSPSEGAKLDAMVQNKMAYEVDVGSKGDHIHVYVDNKEQAVLREKKGSYTFETMSSGPHTLCIKVVNRGHTPIGLEKCVKVTVD